MIKKILPVFFLVLCLSVLPHAAFAKGGEGRRGDSGSRQGFKVEPKVESDTNKKTSLCGDLAALRAEALKKIPECAVPAVAATTSTQAQQMKDTYNQKIKLLLSRARTPSEKSAITTYQKDVTSALEQYRKEAEASQTVFKKSADEILAKQRVVFQNSCNALTLATTQAFDTAQRACDQRKDDSTVRAQLKTDLTKAEKVFVSNKDGDAGLNARIKKLKDVRDESLKTSLAKFTATTTKSLTNLKRVLLR